MMPLLIILLVLMLRFEAQTSDAPYLYYYSKPLNAFVIERADGTDSRTLGENVLPADAEVVYGSWSPSGKWLAWHTFSEMGIISADGQNNIIALVEGKKDFLWSSTQDILLAYDGYVIDDVNFALIDVEQQKIITEFTIGKIELEDIYSHHIVSSPDGRLFSWFYNTNDLPYKTFLRSVDVEGNIIDRQIVSTSAYTMTPQFSPTGYIIYKPNLSTDLLLENVISGEKFPIQAPVDISPYYLIWSSDGHYAVINDSDELWLFSLENKSFSKIGAVFQEYAVEYGFQSAFWSPSTNILAYKNQQEQLVLADINYAQ